MDALKDDYTIILPDARGHGESEKPHDPLAYRMDLLASDIAAVLDDLEIGDTNFFGYSMGGRIGWGFAKHYLDRLRSLTVGGGPPHGSNPNSRYNRRTIQFLKQGIQPYVESLEPAFGEWMTQEIRAMELANDPEALIAWLSMEQPNLEDILPTINIPVLLFVGEADGNYHAVKECLDRLPDATFFSLPGLNHIATVCRVDLTLPRIKEFLDGLNRRR